MSRSADVARGCARHPKAAAHHHHCPACLLESALAPLETVGSIEPQSLTIQVPLGRSAAASVFLARCEGPDSRLLRLKVWHQPAPAAFLDGIQDLQSRLAAWPHPAISVPLAAWLDADGCPSVVTEFRQGLPILDGVRSGRLEASAAIAALGILLTLIRAAHDQGLVHGSIVPGNVLLNRGPASASLLDFGLALLLAGPGEIPAAAADVAGLAALSQALRHDGSDGAP